MRMLLAFIVMVSVPMPVFATDWWKASTDHFIVYSRTSELETRELASELERFDEAMRYLRGIQKDAEALPESAKLTVYQFGSTSDIGGLAGSRGVAGFFIPRAGQSIAFVPSRPDRRRGTLGIRVGSTGIDTKVVLFHEYAHYFMFQHAAAAYPAWYREGFAEVYGTLELIDNGYRIGSVANHRSFILQHFNTYHVSRLLAPPEEMTGEDGAQIYALGWLLAHYLTFSNERPGQLDEYLRQINAGKSPKEAALDAFGDLDQLNRDLDKYRRGRVTGIEVKFDDYTLPHVSVRPLSEAEEAQMELHIKSTRGVEDEEAQQLVPEARDLVRKYPDSIPVLVAAIEAEFDAENYDQSEALARRALELDDSIARAHIHLARIAMRRAENDPAQFAIARKSYARANHLDPANPDPLNGFYLTYRLAGETPPESALIALEQAYAYAPFDPAIRTNLAHLLLLEDRDREALVILGPIINDPHAGKKAKKLRELTKKIEAGDREEAIEYLAPKLNEDDEEDEDENQSQSQSA